MKHTPAPCKTSPFGGVSHDNPKTPSICAHGAGWEKHLFYANLSGAYGGNIGADQAWADAAFIVRACNSHDELLRLLAQVTYWARRNCLEGANSECTLLQEADAAVAKAQVGR